MDAKISFAFAFAFIFHIMWEQKVIKSHIEYAKLKIKME